MSDYMVKPTSLDEKFRNVLNAAIEAAQYRKSIHGSIWSREFQDAADKERHAENKLVAFIMLYRDHFTFIVKDDPSEAQS